MTDAEGAPKAEIKSNWVKNQIDDFGNTHQELESLKADINDGIDKQECISMLEKFKNEKKIFSRKNPHEHAAVVVVGVQAALHHLGYARVGEIDGIWGGKLRRR